MFESNAPVNPDLRQCKDCYKTLTKYEFYPSVKGDYNGELSVACKPCMRIRRRARYKADIARGLDYDKNIDKTMAASRLKHDVPVESDRQWCRHCDEWKSPDKFAPTKKLRCLECGSKALKEAWASGALANRKPKKPQVRKLQPQHALRLRDGIADGARLRYCTGCNEWKGYLEYLKAKPGKTNNDVPTGKCKACKNAHVRALRAESGLVRPARGAYKTSTIPKISADKVLTGKWASIYAMEESRRKHNIPKNTTLRYCTNCDEWKSYSEYMLKKRSDGSIVAHGKCKDCTIIINRIRSAAERDKRREENLEKVEIEAYHRFVMADAPVIQLKTDDSADEIDLDELEDFDKPIAASKVADDNFGLVPYSYAWYQKKAEERKKKAQQ
jgi:hypothetical protein